MTLANSPLHTPASLAAPLIVQLLFDPVHKVLLLPFPGHLTRENFESADAALSMFAVRREPADTIIDFSDVSEDVDTSVIVARAYAPWPVQDKRHVFVVSSGVVRGLFRMYCRHRQAAGLATPRIVRSLEGALAALGAAKAKFDPVAYN